jgi:nucleotide-binding universal stress UspA family protein
LFRLLVATDGSASANKAAEFASRLCYHVHDCEIIVVHVVDVGVLALSDFNPALGPMPVSPAVYEEVERGARGIVEAAASILRARGHKVSTRIGYGSPVHVICNLAHKENVDLVVMGHSGMGRFADVLLGSVADRMAHLCPSPLVIVRRED